MSELVLDIVVFDGETTEDAIKAVVGSFDVTWTVNDPGPSGHPEVTFTSPNETVLKRLKSRYDSLGKNLGRNKGKAPARKGERRI